MTLDSVSDLREIYRPASGGAVDKVIDELDEHCRRFLAMSPMFVLSTASADGVCDASPKGGAPGFVEMLDGGHVAWADYSGNNRLDSFENIVANPSVAMLCLIPGLDETLRINGTAALHTDPELCERLAVDGRTAKVVVVVTVNEAYVHCAKALRRSSLWDTTRWPAEVPDGRAMVRDHAAIDVPLDTVREVYDRNVAETLWQPGGD